VREEREIDGAVKSSGQDYDDVDGEMEVRARAPNY
jgi:hypothetical protein